VSWFQRLLLQLASARSIAIPEDRQHAFQRLLQQDREKITWAQLHKAEWWIIRGDWTHKGAKPILEYADIWPSERQSEGYEAWLAGQSLALVNLGEIKRQHAQEIDDARHDERRRVEAECRAKAIETLQADALDRHARKLFADEYAVYRTRTLRMQAQIERLQQQVQYLHRQRTRLAEELRRTRPRQAEPVGADKQD
jgi:hypothetical protein